jgi:hypothetical protein
MERHKRARGGQKPPRYHPDTRIKRIPNSRGSIILQKQVGRRNGWVQKTRSLNRLIQRDGSEFLEATLLSVLIVFILFFAQWRYGFNWGDEGWLWYISQQTALGHVPIRDVFSYDPGRYYWSAAVFTLLRRSGFFEQLVANYLFGAIGLAASYIALSRAGMSRNCRIAVLGLLGVVLGFPRHKIFEQVLSLISAAGITLILARPERLKRWFAYGLATGLAAFFGRNSGLYFALSAVLVLVFLRILGTRKAAVRALAALAAGIIAGYSPVLIMIAGFRGFASAFYQSVLLTPNWSWGLRIPFPWHSHASGLHGLDALQVRAVSWLCIAVPVTYALMVWSGSRALSNATQRLATGASMAGIPYLHHAFYHADFFHIAQGIVPFVVAVGAFSQHLWTLGRRHWSVACFSGLALLVLASWLPMEPLVQHLRTQANMPETLATISLDGRNFEVPTPQAQVMRRVEAAFRSCGAADGSFWEAPYYPGLYAFLKTRAPSWDVYYLWPRSDDIQEKEIGALIRNRTSLVLVNKDASFDGQDWLRIERTNPKLAQYISASYKRTDLKLPQGFEVYALPRACMGVRKPAPQLVGQQMPALDRLIALNRIVNERNPAGVRPATRRRQKDRYHQARATRSSGKDS